MSSEVTARDVCYTSVDCSVEQHYHSVYRTVVIPAYYITYIYLPQGNRFLSTTGSRTLAFRHKRYGRPSLATAGLHVNLAYVDHQKLCNT